MKLEYDTIIVGAGVAGITAAIYLKRAGVNFLLLEQNYPGGQINRANTINNYPGITSIDGPTLAMNMVEQMNKLDIEVSYEKVLDIKIYEDLKIVKTNKYEYISKTVLLATGRMPRKLELDNENLLIGKGISWCASCDGNLYKDKTVAVVGGGNTAIDDTLYLSNICKKVYLINRSMHFRASLTALDQVKKKNNVEVILDDVIKKINANDDRLESIQLSTGKQLEIDGLFEAIGSLPMLDYTANLNLQSENNYIVVDNNMQTSIDGIFACGDAIKKDLYQIVTATGEGAIAANSIIKYLN